MICHVGRICRIRRSSSTWRKGVDVQSFVGCTHVRTPVTVKEESESMNARQRSYEQIAFLVTIFYSNAGSIMPMPRSCRVDLRPLNSKLDLWLDYVPLTLLLPLLLSASPLALDSPNLQPQAWPALGHVGHAGDRVPRCRNVRTSIVGHLASLPFLSAPPNKRMLVFHLPACRCRSSSG